MAKTIKKSGLWSAAMNSFVRKVNDDADSLPQKSMFLKKAYSLLLAVYVLLLISLWTGAYVQKRVTDHVLNVEATGLAMVAPILIGGFYASNSHQRRLRLEAIYKLARLYPKAKVMIVGGWRPGSPTPNGAAQMVSNLARMGLDKERLSFDHKSNDSISNINNLIRSQEYIDAASLIAVSSPGHVFRLQPLIKSRVTDKAVYFLASEPTSDFMLQLNYEIVAWLSMILPRPWVKKALEYLRHN